LLHRRGCPPCANSGPTQRSKPPGCHHGWRDGRESRHRLARPSIRAPSL